VAQVGIVVDSSSDLPPETVREYGMTVVPLSVHFGDEHFLDKVEITGEQFFHRLASSRQLPKTSAPSVLAFRGAYETVAADASGIVCVTVGSKLSGTYNAASLAARDFEHVPVRVVDSRTSSISLGLIAIAAAEGARSGASLDEVESLARDAADRTNIVFFADTLEYLQKGGRIGRAQALLGSILEMKPVLTVTDGEPAQYARTRTRGKAIQALVDWAGKLSDPERVAVIWHQNETDLNRLLDGVAQHYPREKILQTHYGPSIGVYFGPNAMGVAATEERRGA
jgi:DegV family protein with EDD domain